MEKRREIIKSAVLAAAPLFIPRKVWGANDRLTYGVIGTGGRGRYLIGKLQTAGAQCVALCDVYDQYVAEAHKTLADAAAYSDYKELLSRKDTDFVVIATPDHQHCAMLLASLAAGKDVYQEKPLAHSLAESMKMVEAARKTDRIVQVGMQRRSAPIVLKAKKVIEEGVLGRVSMVKAQFNWKISRPLNNGPLPGKLDWPGFLGSAPQRAMEPMRFRQWRFFWDYAGGLMTDLGAHMMDVVQWLCNDGKPPLSAVCFGQLQKMKGAETPDVVSAVFEYPGFTASWTLNYCSAFNAKPEIVFQGDEASLVMTAEGFRVYKEPWDKPENQKPFREELGEVPVEAHIQNFLDSVRSRKTPNGTVEAGAAAVAAPLLANTAFRLRRQVRLNKDFTVES